MYRINQYFRQIRRNQVAAYHSSAFWERYDAVKRQIVTDAHKIAAPNRAEEEKYVDSWISPIKCVSVCVFW